MYYLYRLRFYCFGYLGFNCYYKCSRCFVTVTFTRNSLLIYVFFPDLIVIINVWDPFLVVMVTIPTEQVFVSLIYDYFFTGFYCYKCLIWFLLRRLPLHEQVITKLVFFSYFLIYSYVMKQFFDRFFVIIVLYDFLWLRCPLYKQRFLYDFYGYGALYTNNVNGTFFSRINCNVRDDFNEYDDHVLICSFFFCLDMRSDHDSLFFVATLFISSADSGAVKTTPEFYVPLTTPCLSMDVGFP